MKMFRKFKNSGNSDSSNNSNNSNNQNTPNNPNTPDIFGSSGNFKSFRQTLRSLRNKPHREKTISDTPPEQINPHKTARIVALAIFFTVVCTVFLMRLVRLQIVEGRPDSGAQDKNDKTTERQVKIPAVRGQIYDCNGKLLVANKYTYNMYLDYDAMPYTRAEWNRTLLEANSAIEKILSDPASSATAKIPENLFFLDGIYPNQHFSSEVMNPDSAEYKKAVEHLTSDDFFRYYIKKYKKTETGDDGEYIFTRNDVVGHVSPADIAEYYIKKYELSAKDGDGNPLYTDEEKTVLMRMYYRLEEATFGLGDRYLLAENVGENTVAYVSELMTRGIGFDIKYSRVYNYPGVASHILGRIGEIYAEDWDYYNALGYPMDAVVGISGCEYTFEEYLRGIDGVMVIVEDKQGRIVDKYVRTEPVPGRDVRLTIDIELQKTAEEALAETIAYTVSNSSGAGTLTGEDCFAGAIVAVTTDGKVRVLASNPTYDLSKYSEDYASLAADETRPLYNRALSGLYAPGSTFKFGMAIAALREGVVTTDTTINCTGIYNRFSDYKPTCWIYNMYGRQHGYENVRHAIRDSCNCYFFEVGYQLGIERMNNYCKLYGLGSATGIELHEETGILAGPTYREDNGLTKWVLGDTVAAAIGQSDNMFNPLQIAMYTTMTANGGTRYKAHLLDSVYSFGSDEPDYVKSAEIAATLDIAPEYLDAVREGMYDVINDAGINYTTYRHFKDLNVKVAGKTGTAQVSKKQSNNGLMTTFAPFDNPELIVTCVLERGNSGSNCGRAIAAVYAKYFDLLS